MAKKTAKPKQKVSAEHVLELCVWMHDTLINSPFCGTEIPTTFDVLSTRSRNRYMHLARQLLENPPACVIAAVLAAAMATADNAGAADNQKQTEQQP